MSSFDDEFGLFGEGGDESERRSTLGARKIATYGEAYKGVPVAALATAARKAAAAIERAGSTTPIEFPTIVRTPVR